jgi:hypothetical protein
VNFAPYHGLPELCSLLKGLSHTVRTIRWRINLTIGCSSFSFVVYLMTLFQYSDLTASDIMMAVR